MSDKTTEPSHEDLCNGYAFQWVEQDHSGGWVADYAICQCHGGDREQDNLRHFTTREQAETWVGR